MMELNKFKPKRTNSMFIKCPALKLLKWQNNWNKITACQPFDDISGKMPNKSQ